MGADDAAHEDFYGNFLADFIEFFGLWEPRTPIRVIGFRHSILAGIVSGRRVSGPVTYSDAVHEGCSQA